jgi:hypothetical protein
LAFEHVAPDADLCEELDHLLPALLAVERGVDLEGLADDLEDVLPRVE